MSSIFWLDIAASMTAAVVALALTMMMLAIGPRNTLNRLFALFTFLEAVWTASSFLLRATLWLQMGNPSFWLEAAALILNLMSLVLLTFTVRYVGYRTKWADVAAALGLVYLAVVAVPTFQHKLLLDPHLDVNGLATYQVTGLGYIAPLLAVAYFAGSAFLFWRERRRTREPYLALGVLILIVGFVVGGIFRTALPYPILSVLTTVSVLVLSYGVISRQLLNPMRELTTRLGQKVDERTRELEEANQSLIRRSTELEAINSRLQEATQRADWRAKQIATGAQIARIATTLLDPDQLTAQVVGLIEERFNFYYVGLFLLDADNRFAVLKEGTGEAGRRLKERGHHLEVGGQSMVGWACANNQARIALDVGQEAVRFANPLLPDTHSEVALPLRVGGRVLGALDAQSTQLAAFDESDIVVLQSMADQVAVALENARLFQRTQAALAELEAANRLLVREGWQGYLEQPQAYRRAEFHKETAPQVGRLSEPLTIPLELRGQSLGRLALQREGGRAWSNEEIEMVQTIALQAALAADNARLIEQTRRALDETRTLYDTSRKITSAEEIRQVVSAVLDSMARTGVHAAAIALFDSPTREQTTRIELVDTWDHADPPRLTPGMRFALADLPLFDWITEEGALVSSDLLADPRLGSAKSLLGGLGFQAMTITPLLSRGQWIGVLFALSEHPHTFTSSELNFHRALADQAAVAIDSRRLFAETQRRAQREALIRQITTRIRAASDVQGVLETTATELAQSLGVSRATVRLATGDAEQNDERSPSPAPARV